MGEQIIVIRPLTLKLEIATIQGKIPTVPQKGFETSLDRAYLSIEVREALTLFASFYPRRANPDELLKMVALEEKARSRFDTLSGGQQQRLAVALALAGDPEIVILDEPTTGLDAQARHELHSVIERLKTEGKTIILTTHYMEEAEKLCDRVAIIDHGKIIATGSPRDLIARSKGQSRIEFRTAGPLSIADLRRIPFIERVRESGGGYELRSSDAPRALIELIKWMEAERHELLDLLLDPQVFRRVHRQAIVNLNHIREINAFDNNTARLTLTGGQQVNVSRNHLPGLRQVLQW